MKRIGIFAFVAALAVLSASGAAECCAKRDHDHSGHETHGAEKQHNHAHEEHGHEEHGHSHGAACGGDHQAVEIGDLALKSMGLSTVHPQKRKMRSTMVLLGRMELASNARKAFPAPVAGRISLKVRELDKVKKGDVLFTVDSPEIKKLSHEIEVLQSRLDVYRKLKTTNAEIAASLKVKISEKASLVAGSEEQGGVVTIRATEDAMVEKLDSADGAWVDMGGIAVSLVRTGDLRFRGIAVASEAAKLRDGMKASVGGADAKVRLGIGDGLGMMPVYAIFEDGSAPGRAGERVKAEIVLDENGKETVAVPDECIVDAGAEPVVFVKDERKAGRFLAVKVRTGISNGGWTEVEGLGDCGHIDVVKDGVYGLKLQLSSKKDEKPVGHFHADGPFHEGEH